MRASLAPLVSERSVAGRDPTDRLPVPLALLLIGTMSLTAWILLYQVGRHVVALFDG